MVLAAGAGRRYGRPKALVERDGQLLVERASATARDGGCRPVVTVLGAAAPAVRARADLGAAIVIDNPGWATGMGSSLRAGLAALWATEAVAVIVLLVDMPGVTPEAVRRLTVLASPDALAMAGYGSHRGHPVLLGRAHWADVAALAVGDVGARPYLRDRAADLRVVPCGDIASGADLDTDQDKENGPGTDRASGHRGRHA
ncbi:molybdopterin-guanine dinucleotide biosynthesis protein A [Micromonospora wenchangensis]|uniref:Molybdopterin-guanine dinucleotide biosynthesis protein A n=1 Tax=Micromonospora wenchangensis TaxID=1185415 RepID=A0A246REH7_9ACTN|nr:molybdopterin-guanine dinucleotide biosynthesis protein A [Micromonospora wenchangensis]